MAILQVFGLFIHFSTGTEAHDEIHWANVQTSTAQYSGMSATPMSVGFYCRISTPSVRAIFHFNHSSSWHSNLAASIFFLRISAF
ncbi:hypothetical protein DFJ58DRAFT_758946 [Suillus subalutaceus]|uniref:uncharacterized protein n=1 Tax=Suillus subalutaceus TaxID=48586 RepID=UPI001B8809AE|nr:uncharacterized protein DFJ58DRAFT_758946 [Suillus subalutaceus]KAG1873546.1 hypothetical protein DFJ58DRAFT_758946 [Suillus subalutaceus]